MWPMAPSEQDIQAKMQEIERFRQSGQAIDASQMDAAGQAALKRLMSGGQAMAPTQPQPAASANQSGQPPQGNNMPPSVMGGHNTPSQYLPQAPQGAPPQAGGPPPQPPPQSGAASNVSPQQGGIWADAEAMQKRRAMSGLPTVQ